MSVTPPASVLFFEHRGVGMRMKMLQDIVHVAKHRCERAFCPYSELNFGLFAYFCFCSFHALRRCEEAAQALLAAVDAGRPAALDA